MLAKAVELGCSTSDVACLCKNANFAYGIRDCSTAVCASNSNDAATVIAYGQSVCAGYASGGSGTTGAGVGAC
jgi:hypothetical protein